MPRIESAPKFPANREINSEFAWAAVFVPLGAAIYIDH
jgi:hypothetical protein